jgi:hypothetical protein
MHWQHFATQQCQLEAAPLWQQAAMLLAKDQEIRLVLQFVWMKKLVECLF